MMNSQATSRIVVGVGLAAVFGIGMSAYVLRAHHEIQVAQDAPAPATPLGPTAAPPDSTLPVPSAGTAAPAEQTANASSAPAAAATAVAPTPGAGATVAGDGSKSSKSKAKARKSDDTASTRVASAPSSEPVASDSQITAEVKSQIATAVPDSSVDVTTTDGVVALAGSAPSQGAVDQAKQAALRVAGVKHVDSSALTITNQISNQ